LFLNVYMLLLIFSSHVELLSKCLITEMQIGL
jgi:hypothetical protein